MKRFMVGFVVYALLVVGVIWAINGMTNDDVVGADYSQTTTYTVVSGDTLWGIIEKKYPDYSGHMGALIYDIQEINDISASLRVGQKLELPIIEEVK